MGVRRLPGRSGYFADLAGSATGIIHAGDQRAGHYIISEHSHQVWELYLQVAGPSTRWKVGPHELLVGPRELLAVPPGMRHQMLEPASGSVHFLFAALDPEALLADQPELLHLWRGSAAILQPECGELIAPFEAFLRDVAYEQRWQELSLRLKGAVLLVEASRLVVRDTRRHLALPPMIDEAVRMLQADEAGALSLTHLAAALHVSPRHLATVFATEVGIPPMTFARQCRLDRVKLRLRDSEDPITTIAADFGFASAQHLATSFRGYTGVSPREYRAGVEPASRTESTA